jgi:hypothetical protein
MRYGDANTKKEQMTGRFSYVGCKGAFGMICDMCCARPRIFHTLRAPNGVERGVCRVCAEEMVIEEHKGAPTFCHARSKRDGGKWCSRSNAEVRARMLRRNQ